jgi:alanine racemase
VESIKEYKDSRAWIEINTNHLQKNIEAFQQILPNQCKIMAAVKADAYGHGAVMIAKFLQYCDITNFCVASVQEGIELRHAGITGNILILSYTSPEQLEDIVFYDLIQTIVDIDYAYVLKEYKKDIRVHLGIDTGMHRLGERVEHIEEIIKL